MEAEKEGQPRSSAGRILMATVKGDVHDIGKNIVGVVLGCNNYEVIDLGVMVPAETILRTAREVGADIVGLSGLITPSLEEMSNIAREMQRQGFSVPLLIGGATTSLAHTAVKIDSHYAGAVVYVKDASRAVGVCSSLLSLGQRDDYLRKLKEDYASVRERHLAQQGESKRVSLTEARANRLPTDWSTYAPPRPVNLGVQVFKDYDLAELVRYIDWTPLFQAWELHGRFPRILEDATVGEEARKLFNDAQAMLQRMIDERWVEARAVVGLFPANSVNDDDIAIYADSSRSAALITWHNLRQQMAKPPGQPNWCLADFVAPKASGVEDYLGAFVVTAGINEAVRVKAFEAAHDDYNAILMKSLCDRLAEAFAERMHERVRREFWGYADAEVFTNEQLIAEEYRGIRPAPGYPACPEHSEKGALFDLLQVPENIGVSLTESYAMLPTASVSGFYFSHPQARYFAVAKIGRDQVEDYARRKGWSVAEAEKWLAPNLGYQAE